MTPGQTGCHETASVWPWSNALRRSTTSGTWKLNVDGPDYPRVLPRNTGGHPNVDMGQAIISIHAPRVGSDIFWHFLWRFNQISIHAPRVGSDRSCPAPSARSRRISIHAPRVGSDGDSLQRGKRDFDISIHAPRVGSDPSVPLPPHERYKITIHAPRVGSDNSCGRGVVDNTKFLSTLPAWGATASSKVLKGGHAISIHAPRVGSDPVFDSNCLYIIISIHAPRVGSDNRAFLYFVQKQAFRSTLPAWGATPV